VKLAALVLSNASFHFSDLSLQLHCNFEVKAFNGTIVGLSSERETTAAVELGGNVDERAPFSIAGKINPLSKDLFVDLTISLTNTDLTAFTPYLEKYGGHPLQKGKLSLALRYEIAQQQVQAQNGVFVDQFTLGPKNNSPARTPPTSQSSWPSPFFLPVCSVCRLSYRRTNRAKRWRQKYQRQNSVKLVAMPETIAFRPDSPKFDPFVSIRAILVTSFLENPCASVSIRGLKILVAALQALQRCVSAVYQPCDIFPLRWVSRRCPLLNLQPYIIYAQSYSQS